MGEDHLTEGSRPGLQSRNLARNRAEVADVALALFDERGFDDVTVDDIAAAAGISRRTFFRYFDSKEGVVLPYEEERLELLRAALAQRPADEPVLATIRRATLAIAAGPDGMEQTTALRRLRIVQEHPAVHAHSLEVHSRWEAAISEVVAEHLGVDVATSVTARVVAGATMTAFRAAVEVWLATGGEADLTDLLAEAYDVLTDGLPLTAASR